MLSHWGPVSSEEEEEEDHRWAAGDAGGDDEDEGGDDVAANTEPPAAELPPAPASPKQVRTLTSGSVKPSSVTSVGFFPSFRTPGSRCQEAFRGLHDQVTQLLCYNLLQSTLKFSLLRYVCFLNSSNNLDRKASSIQDKSFSRYGV